MSETAARSLSSYIRVKHGFAFPGAGFSDDPSLPTLLTPGNFALGGGFKEAKTKTYAGDYPSEYKLSAGDLVINMTDLSKNGDTLGLPAIVPEGGDYLHNQRVGLVQITDPENVHRGFLNYFLRTSRYRDYILGTASGSTVRHTSPSRIGAFEAVLPPVNQQRAIADVLGALDDKIVANTKLAAASMRLAESHYLREVLSVELSMQPLGELATTVLGGTPSRDNEEFWTSGTVPWLNSGKANEDRITQPSAYITEEALRRSAAKLMPEGTTVIAITGATLGQVSRLEIGASGNQSLIGIWSENRALNDWLFFAIQDQIPELLKKATGAAQQHVNKRDVDSLRVPVAEPKELASFSVAATPLLKVAASADIQNIGLAATRVTLLPQLMSGKLRVKDAEKVMENAGV